MEDENGSSVNETEQFIATGRTGRRNAVPDILDSAITTTSAADLPEALQKLSCSKTLIKVWVGNS